MDESTKCLHCNGTGSIIDEDRVYTCNECHGWGVIEKDKPQEDTDE